MKVYHQMKLEEREKIYIMKQEGYGIKEIAKELNRHKTTVYRELHRNWYNKTIPYLPDKADIMAKNRKYILKQKLERFSDLKEYVMRKLKEKWSPDVIGGVLKKEKRKRISAEAIYQYIYSDKGKDLGLYQYLFTGRIKRNQRCMRKQRKTIIPERISIHDRPQSINQRSEIGHFEGDLTFIKGNKSANILVLTERKTKYTLLIKNKSKHASLVAKNAFNALAGVKKEVRKSITFDNGLEFTQHTFLRNYLNIDTYFCDPHSPWQKGQVEKTNAILHKFISKKTSLIPFDESDLLDIQYQFNNIPRKILGYKSPDQLFNKYLHTVALQT